MWKVKEVDSEDLITDFAKANNLRPAIARILYLRDIRSNTDIKQFYSSSLTDLYPADGLPDIDKAIKRIQQAIINQEKIVIWGHEDLDGITSTVILYETIKEIKGFPLFHIPAKGKDKHGLSTEKAKEFKARDAKLIITVDCGITNIQEVAEIKNLGIDVIVTDHHETLESLPDAVANVNPKRSDSKYPFAYLAGVGIALKLAIGLVQTHLQLSVEQLFQIKPDFLGLVALGTISDRVPLISENRIFTKIGLKQLPYLKNPAVNAIFKIAKIDLSKVTNDRFFADVLPILASANGNIACDYFLTRSAEECDAWAEELYSQSQIWREDARQTLGLAEQIAEITPGILFVKDERLSLRALGHVAGKLKDRHQLPALILGKKNNDWIGECRGINGVDLIALLKAHRDYFSAFGGHKKACGFTVSAVKVDEFMKNARKYAKENFAGHIIKENRVIPDAEWQIKDLTEDIFNLRPFGEGNPAPVLISTNTPISQNNGRLLFLERADLDVRNGPDQLLDSDRVFADILYTVDDNHSIVILKVDYPE